MAGGGGGEKTEKATPKKRQDARKDGEVLLSKEVVTAVTVLATFAALSVWGKYMLVFLSDYLKEEINGLSVVQEFTNEFFTRKFLDVFLVILMAAAPIAIVSAAASIIAVIAQTKGLVSMKKIKPKFSHINPFTGIKRLFSLQAVVSIIKGLIEIVVIGFVIYDKIKGKLPSIASLMRTDVISGVAYLGSEVMDVVMTICLLFAFVAVADYLFQWWQYEKKLRMSKQEVKDEYKQLEGNPQIKQRIKQKQQEMAQRRMMAEVPTADVVIKNPTHYAVALRYDIDNDIAPVVVAKGSDYLALRIIAVAEENGVYIQEDRPLAQTLYKTVELGRSIPKELYMAIAEILNIVYKAKNKTI